MKSGVETINACVLSRHTRTSSFFFRHADEDDDKITVLETKMEQQLKEINEKCSVLEKREYKLRKCIRKMSSNKSQPMDVAHHIMSESNQDKELAHNSSANGGSKEEEYVKHMDYHKIVRSALRDYPQGGSANSNISKNIRKTKGKAMHDDDSIDIVDVDEACKQREGRIQILK